MIFSHGIFWEKILDFALPAQANVHKEMYASKTGTKEPMQHHSGIRLALLCQNKFTQPRTTILISPIQSPHLPQHLSYLCVAAVSHIKQAKVLGITKSEKRDSVEV
jgi:hypothetical protein